MSSTLMDEALACPGDYRVFPGAGAAARNRGWSPINDTLMYDNPVPIASTENSNNLALSSPMTTTVTMKREESKAVNHSKVHLRKDDCQNQTKPTRGCHSHHNGHIETQVPIVAQMQSQAMQQRPCHDQKDSVRPRLHHDKQRDHFDR